MQQSARFVSIEGGEGAGKSVFTQGLSRVLRERGIEHLLTREPGGTALATRIREIFLDPPDDDRPEPMTELLLVSAARCQHVRRLIKPSLERGLWLLCDRFYDSTRVYQGFLAGIDRQKLETIIDYSVDGCHPHITFVLDCPPEISMQRVASRSKSGGLKPGQNNRYDGGNLEMHQKLRHGYLTLAEQYPERLKVLDARQTPEELVAQAVAILQRIGSL